MMQVLIVEDDAQVAGTLKDIVEFGRAHVVTDIAIDLESALASTVRCPPDLMMIDLHLSATATGIEVAAWARTQGFLTLFTTADPLPFPVPELALGCLCKPYTCYNVEQVLRIASNIIAGETAHADVPAEFDLY